MGTSFPHSNGLVGRTVGRYRLVEKIGSGGMGSVYRAVHIEIEDLVVAVKLLSQSLMDNEALRVRFKDEAAICARLGERSSHIVQIRDYGILEDLDLPYFTMEYLQGRSLEELIHAEAPLEASLAVTRQICEGLQVAHEMAIVHRDLKPSNIFLIRDPRLGEKVKLLDFGIARFVRAAAVAAQNRQATQGYLGTPHYSSPEQLRGREVDARSDIYSLGMILYELFTGVCPFDIEEESFAAWYHIHLECQPVAMGTANPHRSIPKAVEQVILQCLAKEPGARPTSIRELLQKLGALPVDSTPPPVAPPADAELLNFEQIARLEKQLAGHLGPIAPTLIRQALRRCRDPHQLLALLADDLPPGQRESFIHKASAQLNAGQTLPSSPPTSPRQPAAVPGGIDPGFIRHCERELSLLVGPIAGFLIQNALKSTPGNPAALVEKIAAQLDNPDQARQFRQKLQ